MDPSGHCWGAASGLRGTFYSTTCSNLDMAHTIIASPDATIGQKAGAGLYAGAVYGAHAALALGSTVAAVGCLTGAGTAVCAGAGSAVTEASADGDPTNEAIAAGNAAQVGSQVVQRTIQAAQQNSVWNLNPLDRGTAIEQTLGQNLPRNFPTIDRFVNGTATSIKSIDLTAKTYQNISSLTRTVQGYVNKMINYQGQPGGWAGVTINPNQVTSRAVDLAIPAGQGTSAQMQALQQLQQYATNNGVTLNIVPVP